LLERKSYPQFVKMSHQELEAAVAKLSKSISNLSDLQATVEVMKLVAKMGNGHTVLAQREMEKGRSSLVHRFRPFGAGIF